MPGVFSLSFFIGIGGKFVFESDGVGICPLTEVITVVGVAAGVAAVGIEVVKLAAAGLATSVILS